MLSRMDSPAASSAAPLIRLPVAKLSIVLFKTRWFLLIAFWPIKAGTLVLMTAILFSYKLTRVSHTD